MRARRSPIFRNSDDEARRLERAAAADPSDLEAAARHARSQARAGRVDQCTVEALDLAPDTTLAWASWQRATGEDRIRLFRALAVANVRYPAPAFLCCLGGVERELCSFIASYFPGNANIMEHRLRRILWPYISREPWAIAGPQPRLIEVVAGGNDGNTHQFTGPDGLERAAREALVVEADWAELETNKMRHWRGSGTGFSEWALFLTPTGYAFRYVLYSGDEDDNGVIEWSYQVRDAGHFDRSDPFFADEDLATLSAIHQLGVEIQGMIANYGDSGMHATNNRLERQVETTIMEGATAWNRLRAIQRASDPKAAGVLVPAYSVGPTSTRACALVVIPPSAGVPIVTIGVKRAVAGPRTKNFTPAHAWPELGPWRGEERVLEVAGRAMAAKLLAWSEAQPQEQHPHGRGDRVRANARVMLRWAQWVEMQQIRQMS